jgi:hypothetical protein
MRGKIYVLSNDAMPDYIKIGFTSSEEVETRMKQLDTTGLPLPFRLHACIEIDNAQQLERLAHDVFASHRARPNREFFLMEPETAVRYFHAISLNDGTARWIAADQQMIDETGQSLADDKVVKPKLASFTFESAGVQVGGLIEFVREPSFQATVVTENEVEFEGHRTKLSPLARILFERIGQSNTSGAYQGPLYFSYQDEILSERRRRLAEDEPE